MDFKSVFDSARMSGQRKGEAQVIEILAQVKADESTLSDAVVRLLAVVGGILGLFTAVVAYANARRGKPYNSRSGSTLGSVVQIEAPEPAKWHDKRFPDDWQLEETRKHYWIRQRRLSLAMSIGAGLVAVFGFFGYLFNVWDIGPLWLFYSILAVPYYFGGLRRGRGLEGEPWKESTVRGRDATIHVSGTREDVIGRCLVTLNAIGGSIVKFDSATGSVVAATGRETWWYTPQRIELAITDLGHKFEVCITSDNPSPAPEGALKPNLINVRRFVAEMSSSPPQGESTITLPDEEVVES
jgi:hypothetical protein